MQGQIVRMRGYVTTLCSVTGKGVRQLETALGYNLGALDAGYTVFELLDPVAANEFEWKDRTRYSDGWHTDWSIRLPGAPNAGWGVQRADELRSALGKKLNYNEAAVDAEIAQIMARQVRSLNVRFGPERIVKVKPARDPAGFPDSGYRDIPQWRLKVEKNFRAMV